MGLLSDLDKMNRKLFTKWSFIENRKLLLLWCNGISLFYILNLVFHIDFYGNAALVLVVLFLVIEIGEILYRRKPKTESEPKDREINIGRLTIHLKGKKEEVKTE